MKMLRNFIPVSRHFNVLESPERLSSQFLRLTRCDLQNQIICRLVHKKVNSKPNSKVADDGLFDHLRSIKVTKSSKYEKRPPRQYENQKTYRRKFENEFDLFNVIRKVLNNLNKNI